MRIKPKSNTIGILVFLAPVLILFGMYFVYPLGFVFSVSLFDWNGVSTPEFIWFQNFADHFADATFRISFVNNIIWLLSLGFVQITLAAVMAMILARRPKGWRYFRTIYFLPNVISQVAIAAMWSALYNAEYGAINSFLEIIGLGDLTNNWLGDLNTALPAILIQQVLYIGYFMIIILASRLAISESYYEVAEIDGANVLQQELYITLPHLREILITTITLAMAYGLRHFEATFLLTRGGPANRTSVLGIQLYNDLASLNYGPANATGVVLVLFGLVLITVVRFVGRIILER